MQPVEGFQSSGNTPPAAAPALRGITWMTKDGLRTPNYFGSLTQAATCRIGNYRGEEIFTPFSSLLPMVHPNDMVIGGWDISAMNLADSMERAKVLDFELQKQLVPYMRCADDQHTPPAGNLWHAADPAA